MEGIAAKTIATRLLFILALCTLHFALSSLNFPHGLDLPAQLSPLSQHPTCIFGRARGHRPYVFVGLVFAFHPRNPRHPFNPRSIFSAMSIKFLHVADTHIGVETHGRLDSGTGLHTRLQDFIKSLHFAFEEAIKEEVDFVVFAGDAYRSCESHAHASARICIAYSHAQRPRYPRGHGHRQPRQPLVAYGKASSVDIFGTLGHQRRPHCL